MYCLNSKNTKKKNRKAFSLIELLVVIVILGTLAALVVPNIMGTGEKARRDIVCIEMNNISQALKMFKLDNGSFPDTEEGLEALLSNPDGEKYPAYGKPYMEKLPKDSWQNPFSYLKNDNGFELISFGADRKEGGSDDAEDILFSQCQK